MKKLFIIMTCVALLTGMPVQASDQCNETINVRVNGLVCDFCARALEKVFSAREEVSGIHVNLDEGLVAVIMKSGQTIDNQTLTGLITDSGYNVVSIQKGC